MSKQTLKYRKHLMSNELNMVNLLKRFQLAHQLYLRELEKEDRDPHKLNTLKRRNIATLIESGAHIQEMLNEFQFGFGSD